MGRIFTWIFILLLIVGGAFVYWKYYFVLGEGARDGELNFMVKKGYIFKTWEGKLIQTGLRSKSPNTVQSYDFDFSVANEELAQKLLANQGKLFNLHYKEYQGSLPWRGHNKYVVDSIISMTEITR